MRNDFDLNRALCLSLAGSLIKRGRKFFWIGECAHYGKVMVRSCAGQAKSFPMDALEAQSLVQRAAYADDMDPSHANSAHKMLGFWLVSGSEHAAIARGIVER